MIQYLTFFFDLLIMVYTIMFNVQHIQLDHRFIQSPQKPIKPLEI